MSTAGQFSSKNPTIKRILKEASELATSPSPDYHAHPLEDNLFEWHFTLRGPPAPSPLSTGIYHGRIVLPPAYPLKPPSFRFLTPSGRFEPNREICLSISGHHEETWQPAWGVRTALVAIRAFMDSDAGGQVGGMNAHESVKVRLAGESRGWRCGGCGGRSNEEILAGQEVVEGEEEERRMREEEVAKEISFKGKQDAREGVEALVAEASGAGATPPSTVAETVPVRLQAPTTVVAPPVVQRQQRHGSEVRRDVWLDRAIIGILCALAVMIVRRML